LKAVLYYGITVGKDGDPTLRSESFFLDEKDFTRQGVEASDACGWSNIASNAQVGSIEAAVCRITIRLNRQRLNDQLRTYLEWSCRLALVTFTTAIRPEPAQSSLPLTLLR
jgi:hypothetical protein